MPGHPGFEASTDGLIRNARTGRILKPQPTACKHGTYMKVALGRKVNRKGRSSSNNVWVHRLVCAAFRGPSPEGRRQVRHLDGDSRNNAAANLDWGSQSMNERDKRFDPDQGDAWEPPVEAAS